MITAFCLKSVNVKIVAIERMFMFLQNSYFDIQTPKVMVLTDETFQR